MARGGKVIDLTGRRFGHLTVIEQADRDKWDCITWRCVCDCGKECVVRGYSLKSGNTKTCGCRNYRKPVDLSKRDRINKRIQRIWAGMHTRCYNENVDYYKHYGGRGIKMCDEWIGENGCRHFYEWAKKNGYKDGLTIDRIDNDGNYEPSNCRWITKTEQMSNMQKSIRVSYKGKEVSPVELSGLTGININTVYSRLRKIRKVNMDIDIIDCSDWKPPK